MDRLKRFALKKTTDSLDKVLEAKAHFDKREERKQLVKDIMRLKEVLLDKMFHSEEKDGNAELYECVMQLNILHTKKEFDGKDKRLIQDLIGKYDK